LIRSAGVEGGCGILRDVRDQSPAEPLALERRKREDVAALDAHLAAHDSCAAARVPEYSEADGRLARARLADEAEHVARGNVQRDLVDDVLALPIVHLDAEVDNLE
jgi:hypothetical protein